MLLVSQLKNIKVFKNKAEEGPTISHATSGVPGHHHKPQQERRQPPYALLRPSPYAHCMKSPCVTFKEPQLVAWKLLRDVRKWKAPDLSYLRKGKLGTSAEKT